MELKEYQKRVLKAVEGYLKALAANEASVAAMKALPPELAKLADGLDAPKMAWKTAGLEEDKYKSKKDGLGNSLPHFCLKIPTGGGKTLLAIETIGSAVDHWRKSSKGLIVWFVPTNQIYRQTLAALQDKSHPYRQRLDNISGDKTMIVEKSNGLSQGELDDNLVILLLMLPSANRKAKETLKMFQDSGAYTGIFPEDDNYIEHKKLSEAIPNLDVVGDAEDLFGRVVVKSSLGNIIRLLRPMAIVDEGQKTYSAGAQATLQGLNPIGYGPTL